MACNFYLIKFYTWVSILWVHIACEISLNGVQVRPPIYLILGKIIALYLHEVIMLYISLFPYLFFLYSILGNVGVLFFIKYFTTIFSIVQKNISCSPNFWFKILIIFFEFNGSLLYCLIEFLVFPSLHQKMSFFGVFRYLYFVNPNGFMWSALITSIVLKTLHP